jgi:hypothetical protein
MKYREKVDGGISFFLIANHCILRNCDYDIYKHENVRCHSCM